MSMVHSPSAHTHREAEDAVVDLWPVGSWLSAALDDPSVCHEMKADIRAWFKGGGSIRVGAHPELNPSTDDLVNRFAAALKEKLAKAERKYGYSDGWLADDWHPDLVRKLAEHVQKGDPRDVAAYCAFAWHHGWPTADYQQAAKTEFCCDAARGHFDAFEGVVRARIEAQTRLDQMTQNHNEALRLYSKWRSRAEKAEAELECLKPTTANSVGTKAEGRSDPTIPVKTGEG